jgi:arabinose-5-phosphate isomerase
VFNRQEELELFRNHFPKKANEGNALPSFSQQLISLIFVPRIMNIKPHEILSSARRTIQLEADTVEGLLASLDGRFVRVVELLLTGDGRLVISGVGKSANIAQKLVATFNSTGQPSVFMHAADAIHGDLGNVQRGDVVLCISKSGDSPEIKMLVPLLRSMGTTVVGMVANQQGYLARECDVLLHTPVEREACPHNLAPTSSTAAQLAMGDALAVALMEARGFTARDFARFHPGGALGKKLYVTMGDLVGAFSRPEVSPDATGMEVIVEISDKRLGAAAVTESGVVRGIITDGDIRRLVERGTDFRSVRAKDMMAPNPKTIEASELAVEGFRIMESHQITQLIVMEDGSYKGIVHLHEILREGIF